MPDLGSAFSECGKSQTRAPVGCRCQLCRTGHARKGDTMIKRNFKPVPISKRERRLRRKEDNERLAKESRFWKNARSAIQLGYNKPVNRQAAKDLNWR